MKDLQILTHGEPAWGDQADLLISMFLEDEPEDAPVAEQLYAKRLSENTAKICCIPGFVYGLALGDLIEVDSNNVVLRVVESSGRCVFRAYFGEFDRESRLEVAHALYGNGAICEGLGPNLVAIDIPDEAQAQVIFDILQKFEEDGRLHFETGKR